MMKRTKKALLNFLCVVLAFSAMAFGMVGCGKKPSDDETGISDAGDSFSGLHGKDDWGEQEEQEEPEKTQEQGNTLRGQSFRVEEDGSFIVIDDDMEFVWYQDEADLSNNYFGGPCEVYYGEEAYDYIMQDYAENGVYRKKSVFNFSEEKMAEFFEAAEEEPIYSKDNMICMILHHENIVVEDEYQEKLDGADTLNVDTYYWGFYDGEVFLCYNIESSSGMTWIPVDGNGSVDLEDDGDDIQTDNYGDDGEESGSAGDSCEIEIGSGSIIIDVPSDAENVYAGAYTLSYDQGDINVEYSDSFCELTDDALEELGDLYAIWDDSSDNLSNIEPVETQVGTQDAYYCRTVDEGEFVCYIFFVDIGEENYMDVTITGQADDLSEEKAFELANVDFRRK